MFKIIFKNIDKILLLIVILAAAFRFSYLVYNPPSLNWDEISHGYNAYSILKTGGDQWGQKFPIFNFRAYGDYPTTLNLYLTIPFIAIFGLTEFAIRFPHALFGTLTVISIYYLAFGITKKRNVSLLAALLAGIEPWYVFSSRSVLQSNLSVFFLITAGAFFVNREKNKWMLPLSFVSLFLTLFAYHTTRIFSPLMLFGLLIIYRNEFFDFLKRNKVWGSILSIFIAGFFILSVVILRTPESRARSGVLFLIDQGAVNRIESLRTVSKLPDTVKRLIYNRPVYFVEAFSKNYISYFSPQFLFLQGGTQYQFSIPGRGLLNPVGLPFFYIGLVLLIIYSFKNKNYRVILLWIILAPIPASITNESFAVIRATTTLPIPEILVALGFYWVIGKIGKKFATVITVIFFVAMYLFAENYFVDYFSSYRANYSWSWQYGYQQVVDYSKNHYSDYDKIIVTKKYGEPHEYFLFFLKYDPAKYLGDPNKITFFQSDWWWVDHFDKFWFVNDWQVKELVTESKVKIDCSKIKCLLITSPDNAPPGWKKLETVNFLDGSQAFEIYNNSK